MLGNNILYGLGIHKHQIRLCFSVCTDCSNAFELDYFSHFHLVEPIFSEDLEAGFPKLFVLELNWVIGIGAWGGCVPLLETAERGTRDRPVGGAGGTI